MAPIAFSKNPDDERSPQTYKGLAAIALAIFTTIVAENLLRGRQVMRARFSGFLFHLIVLTSVLIMPTASRALPTDDWILVCSLVYKPAPSPTPTGKFEVVVRERRMMECVSKQVPGSGDPPPASGAGTGEGPRRGGAASDKNGGNDPIGQSCDALKSRLSSLDAAIAKNRADMDAATDSLDIINTTLANLASTGGPLLSAMNRSRSRCEAAESDLEAFIQAAAFKTCAGMQGEKRMDCMDSLLERDAAKPLVAAHEKECGAYSTAASQYSQWRTTKGMADRKANSLTRDIGKLRVENSRLRDIRTAFSAEYQSRCVAYP
jgi:hypothetical protein